MLQYSSGKLGYLLLNQSVPSSIDFICANEIGIVGEI